MSTSEPASDRPSLSNFVESLYLAPPPSQVAHYTSLDALLSILGSSTIRATKVGYLNDGSELAHAAAVAASVSSELASSNKIPRAISDMLSKLSQSLDRQVGQDCYVACFSEKTDDLSQWRAYTPHGQGVSLIFSSAVLRESATRSAFSFGRCVYRRDEQSKLLAEALVVLADEVCSEVAGSENPDSIVSAIELRFPDLTRLFALLKSGAFIDEGEWRAVRLVERSAGGVHFRVGRSTLIPFVELDLRDPEGGGLALSRAIHGPTSHPDLARLSLAHCLSANRVRSQRYLVDVSRVPYRMV